MTRTTQQIARELETIMLDIGVVFFEKQKSLQNESAAGKKSIQHWFIRSPQGTDCERIEQMATMIICLGPGNNSYN